MVKSPNRSHVACSFTFDFPPPTKHVRQEGGCSFYIMPLSSGLSIPIRAIIWHCIAPSCNLIITRQHSLYKRDKLAQVHKDNPYPNPCVQGGGGKGGDSMTKTTLCSCHRKTDESRPCCYIAHLIFAIAMNDVVDQAKVGGTFNHTLLVKDLLVSFSQ